jgi:surfeit locus 1 family protein
MTPVLQRSARGRALRSGLAVCGLVLFVGFAALGTWQVERRTWKLDLIERVNQRIHAPAVPAPREAEWAQLEAAAIEYRHVRLTGRFMVGQDTFVQAVTALGSGFWMLSPFQRDDGSVVLVNRGFVTSAAPAPDSGVAAPAVVTGLLRLTEPAGGFLRSNDPAANRWFSRDVAAIAGARKLGRVAPYFVDEEASAAAGVTAASGQPVAGLTVVAFRNNHLVYAITWYALALMVAGAAVLAVQNTKRHDPSRAHPSPD